MFIFRNMADNDDLGDVDFINMSEDEKEKYKQKLNRDNTKDKLIDMFMKVATDWKSTEEKLKTTESDKQNLEDKLAQSVDDLDKKEKLLQEEKEFASGLAMKLTSGGPVETPKPAVLLITDSQMLFNRLSATSVEWSIIMFETTSQCVTQIGEHEKEMHNIDLAVIMIGREEIVNGGDGIQIVSQISKLTTILDKMGIPFKVAQLLPVKGPKGRMEINIVNRKIMSTNDWSPLNTFRVFESAIEREIFKDKKLNIEESLLTRTIQHMEKLIGTPEIRDKPTGHESDSEVITEFVPIQKRIHAKRIIGKKGARVQALQKKYGAHISVIDYKYKQSLKHGAIVTGDKTVRNKVKAKMDEMVDNPYSDEDDDDYDKENDDTEDKGVKRNKRMNVLTWAKKPKK